jgi:hypothetical protein
MLRRCSLLTFVFALAAANAAAGDWHVADKGKCTDCHTQHNSDSGQPMRTDQNPNPATYMLLRQNINELCLSCHDGSRPEAPDVIAPVSYVSDPAGGYFADTGGSLNGLGHALGVAATPPGGTTTMTLTCVSCHDPHGNTNYRNLRLDPTGTKTFNVVVTAAQTVAANGSNAPAVYVPANVIDQNGISAWCSTCHGTQSTNDHPADALMWGSMFADYSIWSIAKTYRVRSGNPSDIAVPSHDDRVICLSCHKAHGWTNPQAQIYADGSSITSTCEECHAQ